MEATRIDNKELKAAMQQAVAKLDEALAIVAPYLELLTEVERASVPRARDGFEGEERGRLFAREVLAYPKVVAAVDFDSASVLEDLDNLKELVSLERKVDELKQRIKDSRLVWLGEAWIPSLAAYRVAKSIVGDAGLEALVSMLAPLFATYREKKK